MPPPQPAPGCALVPGASETTIGCVSTSAPPASTRAARTLATTFGNEPMLCVQNTSQPAPSNATAGDALPTAAGPTVIGVASVPVRSSRAARIVGLLSAEVARSSHVSRCWPLPNASAGAVALDTPPRPQAVPSYDEGYRITTLHPHSYNDARAIGEHFRSGTPVIMNLTEMDDTDAKRLVDFAAGLIFGLHGRIERVTNKVFLLSPEHVEVTAEDKARIAEGGFFNQS